MCPILTPPTNGSVIFTTRVGDMAHYGCDTDFQLLGEDKRVCQANGTWTGQDPSCFLPCPTLTDPENGTVMQNGTEPGSSACYSCDQGFKFSGCSSTSSNCNICRTCGVDGKWSGTEPKCLGMKVWIIIWP